MGEYWSFALFPGGIIGILAVIAHLQQRSWLAPGAFFSLFWTIGVTYPLLMSNYPVTQGTLWWVIAFVSVFCLGSFIGDGSLLRVARFSTIVKRNYGVNYSNLSYVVIICTVLGFLSIVVNLLVYGYHITNLLSWEGYIQIAMNFTRARYSGQLILSPTSQLLLVFAYAGPLFAGLLCSFDMSRKSKILAILSLVPSVAIAFIQTTRSTIAYGGILFLAGRLSGLVLNECHHVRLFTAKRVVMGLMVVALVGFGFAVLQLVRGGEVSLDQVMPKTVWLIRDYYTEYLGMHAIGFEDSWYGDQSPSFGAASFAGISNALGIRKRAISMSSADVRSGGALRSNIPSLFIGLSKDFTIPGALVVLFLWGVITGLSYRKVAKGQILYLPALAVFYAVTIWSPMASLLGYNSIIGAFVLFFGYIFLIIKKCRSYKI